MGRQPGIGVLDGDINQMGSFACLRVNHARQSRHEPGLFGRIARGVRDEPWVGRQIVRGDHARQSRAALQQLPNLTQFFVERFLAAIVVLNHSFNIHDLRFSGFELQHRCGRINHWSTGEVGQSDSG